MIGDQIVSSSKFREVVGDLSVPLRLPYQHLLKVTRNAPLLRRKYSRPLSRKSATMVGPTGIVTSHAWHVSISKERTGWIAYSQPCEL